MKYILPLLLLLSACTPDTKTTDAASAPKTHGFAHRLTEGEKLLTQALIKQDLAAYFKHETGGAFAEQAPLFSAQQLAEQKNIPQNDAIGVYGKIIKTQGRTAWLQTDKQTLKLDLAEPLQEAASDFTGNFKACATTMTEYCTSRLAREMPESAVRKKAQELGLTEIAFKKKK